MERGDDVQGGGTGGGGIRVQGMLVDGKCGDGDVWSFVALQDIVVVLGTSRLVLADDDPHRPPYQSYHTPYANTVFSSTSSVTPSPYLPLPSALAGA